MVHVVKPQKAQQERKLVCSTKKKVQEGKKKLRRIEESEAAHMAKSREAQQE